MQHLDEGFLHALADGEVPSEELLAVREHLAQCESCRVRLDEARVEAETARELVELIEVPALDSSDRRMVGSSDRRIVGSSDRSIVGSSDRPIVGSSERPGESRWMRTLAWAATLVLAAGIGYYGRGEAPFAPAAQPISVAAKIDTVFLEIPAEAGQVRENEPERRARLDERPTPQQQPASVPPAVAAAPPHRDDQGARREADQAAATEAPGAERKSAATGLARRNAAAPAAPTVALAEERLMAKSAADAAAVMVTFPRAVELLGGRIKLIEGMVPARLEAMGRVVRVIYTVDEGDIVLAQVAGVDSLNWSLSGPLGADSLGRLRLRVK